jgi:AcrR family transcriptional regulator
VFIEQGLAGASMSQIAERAGVAVGTLYNRFKDREALLQALLAQRRAELLEEIEAASQRVGALGPAPAVDRGWCGPCCCKCEQHRPFLRLVLASEWAHGPSKEAMLRGLRERLGALLVSAERRPSAELRRDPTGSLPVLLLSLVRGMLERDRYGLAGARRGHGRDGDRGVLPERRGSLRVMSPSVAPSKPVNKWLVALSVTFGTLMGTIDASIVNVATPTCAARWARTVQEITWVTTGFVIANVIVMPLTAFLGRLFGQKQVYQAALCLFVSARDCAAWRAVCPCWSCSADPGPRAGALQPTEQAISASDVPAGGAGHGHGAVRRGRGDRARVRADAGRLHRRQL